MTKLWLCMIPLFAGTLILCGRKKNSVEETYNPIVKPVIPDFTTRVNASVNGFITDENGNAVAGAVIEAGNIPAVTDEYGYFKIRHAGFAKSAGFIQVSKPGYFTGYRTFLPAENRETFIRMQLIPKATTGIIDAGTGGAVSTTDGATVTLPANAVVVASTNDAYTGPVNIAAHWLNPADAPTTLQTMPGDLTGVDTAGYLNVLATYGMLAVELTAQGGEKLQIAAGKKALLHFPIPSSLAASAPATIPLWYFDELYGVWKQEGSALKTGSSYEGEVSHFTYWNCDVGFPLVNFTAQLVDTALHPLCNVPVTVGVQGEAYAARVAYTDTNGVVNGLVPANKSLAINVTAPCNQGINVKAISTANEPIDLGTVKVNLNEYRTILQGTVTKCNGSPVTDGFVIVSGLGGNSFININNGSFSAAGVFCPGTNASFVAFDRETSQGSDVQMVQLTTGTNTIEPLLACSSNPGPEAVNIEFTGTDPMLFTLPQYMFGGNFYFLNDSTSINAIDLLNGNQQVLQFSFTGPAAPGTYPLSNNTITANGISIVFWDPQSVTVTNYGLVGQFITGHFTGVASIGGTSNENVDVNFNIQRDQ